MTTTTAPNAHSGRPRALLALWLLLLTALVPVAALAQQATGLSADALSLVMLAPGLAALALRACVGRWFATPWPPVPGAQLLVPMGLATLFGGVYLATLVALTGRLPQLPSSPGGLPLLLVVGLQALGALGEELGWRGLVQRAGEQLAPPLVVAGVAGAAFGATHLGYWSLGPVFVGFFTLSTVLLSLAMALSWRGDLRQRMVVCTLVHLLVNLSLLVVPLTPSAGAAWQLVVPAAAGLLAVLAVRAGVTVGRPRQGLRYTDTCELDSEMNGVPAQSA